VEWFLAGWQASAKIDHCLDWLSDARLFTGFNKEEIIFQKISSS
jgi:hypothetical protein